MLITEFNLYYNYTVQCRWNGAIEKKKLLLFRPRSTANRHLLRRLAHAGAGAYEVFDAATKYKWEERVTRQLSKAAQPSLSSVSVSWQQFDSDVTPLQAPSHVTALFSGSRQVIYGFVPNCTRVSKDQ